MGEPPCSQVLLTVCRRRSMGSPHQRGNTPYGSEDPSWLPCPPSNRCGSPKQNTTSLVHPSSTENASKRCADTSFESLLATFAPNVSLAPLHLEEKRGRRKQQLRRTLS